jgi:DNA-directed RNA polymerase subunit RPC12/RpoP
MIHLREKDLHKLSAVTQIPFEELCKLSAMCLLNEPIAVDLLIVKDWRKLKAGKRYTRKQIIGALMDEYKVSSSKVESAIYNKKEHLYHCSSCGRRIPKGEHTRNESICDKCVSRSIQL